MDSKESSETTIAITEKAVTDRIVSGMRDIAEKVAIEAAQDYAPVFVDPREAHWDSPHSMPLHNRPYYQSDRSDRQDGRYLPIYDTESDLRMLRAMTRLMAETVPAAATIMERLCDYTVGSGYDYQIIPSDGEKPNALSRRAERIWTRFGDENGWFVNGEREAFRISHEEGEWLAWPEPVRGGGIELCDATTDEITEPVHARELEEWLAERYGIAYPDATWHFGVHRRTRGRRILGFHIVRDKTGVDWDYVPADRACWLKRYTPSRANRGVSAFYLPHQYIQRGDKVFRNTAEGAAIQAAIAYIIEHAEGVTKNQAEALTASQAIAGELARAYVQTKGGSTTPRNVAGMAPGTVPHVKHGQKVHAGPLGSQQSPIYLEVMQAALRMSGALWAMSEGMTTGDWSNGNYASSLTAEAPFVKGREADQALTGQQFGRLPWLVFRVAYLQGAFRGVASNWEQVEYGLEVNAQAPSVAARDMDKESQRLQLEYANGVISKRTWRTKAGYDPDAEADQIAAERGDDVPPAAQSGLGFGPSQADQQARDLSRTIERQAGLESVTRVYP